MSDIGALVERLVAGGISIGEASTVIAEAFAAGAESAIFRSSGAARQSRYRERERNKTVTKRNAVTPDETVTERNESITNRNEVTPPLSIESNKIEKKREGRASQLPSLDWRPSEKWWAEGLAALGSSERAERELAKFKNDAVAKGKVFKNWDFAWRNWFARSLEWSPLPAAAVIQDAAPVNWDSICANYKKFGYWSKHAPGNEPGLSGCQCPPEILQKHGIGGSASVEIPKLRAV